MNTYAVILAGGSGTRLWPLSRTKHPKQFLPILGTTTMLQQTVDRVNALGISSIIVICNEEHRFLAAEQLKEIDSLCPIILEPEGRNTAPAIAIAALHCDKDSILFALPSDHFIEDLDSFKESYEAGLELAKQNKLITFGICPSSPNTGYGYIKQGKSYHQGFMIDSFVEKPSLAKAKEYKNSGNFLWNSGMFLFKPEIYLDELQKFRVDIFDSCKACIENSTIDLDFIRLDEKAFSACPSVSIDYAVMEKTDDAVVIPMNAGWSDIGSWSSLFNVSPKDKDGNVIHGDIFTRHTKKSIILSNEKLVTVLGVDNLIIVVTKDAVLVANKNSSEDIKLIADDLKNSLRPELDLHREVYRPWGKYDSVDQGDSFQVKRITVKPGEKLSVQKHHHRSEHWIVVAGIAIVTRDEETFSLKENESIYIPLGSIHSLENPGLENLELIEVQTGEYLGEDDIVRYEDRYNRNTEK